MRVDRWLWAARFFKTRSLAAEAVVGGLVHVGGERVKPARPVRVGDEVEVLVGRVRRTVIVRALAERRGPAAQAAALYEETPESIAAREMLREQERAAAQQVVQGEGRPTKRDRRRYEAARRGGRG